MKPETKREEAPIQPGAELTRLRAELEKERARNEELNRALTEEKQRFYSVLDEIKARLSGYESIGAPH